MPEEADTQVLEGALQERMLALLASLLCPPDASAAGQRLLPELAALEALAEWLQVQRCRHVQTLCKVMHGLARADYRQRLNLLPHGLRLVYHALGPAWRRAPVHAVLSGQCASRQATAQRERLQDFCAGLPAMPQESLDLQAARKALQQHMQQAWRAVADAAARAPLALSSWLASGLPAQLRRLQHLSRFLGTEAASSAGYLQGLLLFACSSEAQQAKGAVQGLLWRLALGRSTAAESEALWQALLLAQAPGNTGMDAHPEVLQGRRSLQQWLGEAAAQDERLPVSEAALFECARLAWVFEALGAPLLYCFWGVVHRLCMDCWYRCLPLTANQQQCLAAMLVALDTQHPDTGMAGPDATQVGDWLGCLVQDWPLPAGQHAVNLQATLRLRDPEGGRLPACQLQALPELLATSLRVLPAPDADWFRSHAQWQAQRPDLERDLHLLEQGAAALRLSALERYCALLLEAQQLVSCRPHLPFPAALLQQCQLALLDMLDRAAQWLEPLPPVDHVAALHDWTAMAAAGPNDARANGAGGPMQALLLQDQLLQLLRPAARVLDRSLRLQVDCPPRIAEGDGQALELPALLVILRWLLACSETDTREQREAGLPQALVVSVHSPWPGELRVHDAWSTRPPDARQLRRLQRKSGAVSLDCQCLPEGGRCFTLLLS